MHAKLKNLLNDFTILDFNHVLHIFTKQALVWVEHRNHYCDRGRFILKVESYCPVCLTVDHSDMFPRYYFHQESVLNEILSWFDARSIEIIDIAILNVNTDNLPNYKHECKK